MPMQIRRDLRRGRDGALPRNCELRKHRSYHDQCVVLIARCICRRNKFQINLLWLPYNAF